MKNLKQTKDAVYMRKYKRSKRKNNKRRSINKDLEKLRM